MGRAIEGILVLLLLSLFFAHLIAPAIDAVRRRVRTGRRNRPISRAAALLVLYIVLALPAAIAWRIGAIAIEHWVHVTAPVSVDRLFSGANFRALEATINRVPVSEATRAAISVRAIAIAARLEREARSTLQDLIAAAPQALWLAAVPILAFVLLTVAAPFRRSALRLLPRGHLQWRAGEFLHDVNSALAGYVRAQSAAGIIVGLECVTGFTLLGLPSAVSMGVAAGVLELVPAIGPATMALVAMTQVPDRALAIAAFLAVLRVVQDYVIYPRLVRRGMHLPTPAVIVTIWIGAVLAGAAGVILAIPVAGIISVSVRHIREYRDIERLVRDKARG